MFCSASLFSLGISSGLGEVIKLAPPTRTFSPTSGHKFKGTLLFPSTWGETSADNRGCWRHSPDLRLCVIYLGCQTSKGPLWIWCPQRVKDSLLPNCANRFFKCLQRIITACWGSSAATWRLLAVEEMAEWTVSTVILDLFLICCSLLKKGWLKLSPEHDRVILPLKCNSWCQVH